MNPDMTSSVLNLVNKYAEANRISNESDYVGDDGLLRCGVCHEPKEKKWTYTFKGEPVEKVIARPCKCERERREVEDKKIAKADAERKVKRLREASMMESRFKDARFENFQKTKYNVKNYDICRRYVDAFDKMLEKDVGLLMYGDVGTGKSYAAACIANELIDKGIPVIMTSFVKLLYLFGSNDPDKKYESDRLLERLMRCKLAILDDLGAERSSDYALERIYDVINSRDERKLPTIVTTNIQLEEMKAEEYEKTKRIYDRIMGSCYAMQWSGPSWRKAQMHKRYAEIEEILTGGKT